MLTSFGKRLLGNALALTLLAAAPASAATLTVTSAADTKALDAACTLREAIENVNAGSGTNLDCPAVGAYGSFDQIHFAITPLGGVKTIVLTGPLPAITKEVTIDAYTQAGASPGTNLASYPDILPVDAVITVEIDAAGVSGSGAAAMTVASGGSSTLIRGLAMGNLNSSWEVLLDVQATAFVFGDFFGVRADGATPWPNNSSTCVKVGPLATYTSIGMLGNTGGSGASRNVFMSCGTGVMGLGAQGLVVNGNVFGTGKSGATLPGFANRGSQGIRLGPSGAISTSAPDIRFNALSGYQYAIAFGGVYQPTVQSNLLGVSLDPSRTVLGNAGYGVAVYDLSTKGGYSGNTIAGSGIDGIVLSTTGNGYPVSNGLTGNSIWGSGGLGINLWAPGEATTSVVTPNHVPPATSGPNLLQNYPSIDSVVRNGDGSVTVHFTLVAQSNTFAFHDYSISAYANPACNPSGHGEGRYLGGYTGALQTDASGTLTSSLTVPAGTPGWTAGSQVTLLAHDIFQNNTSEFSACMAIPGAAVTPSRLAFVQQPTDAAAGTAIAPAVTVRLEDAGGSPVAQAGVSVAVALASGAGALSGMAAQVTDAAGQATFAGLSIDLAGTKTLSASSAGLSGSTSSSFVISAGAPTTLTVSGGSGQSTPVGTAFPAPLQVLLADTFGNPVGGASIAFTAPASGPGATLATSPAVTDSAGHAQVTATANGTPGAYAVTASYATLPPASFGLSNTLAAAAAANVPTLGTWGLVLLGLALSGAGLLIVKRGS